MTIIASNHEIELEFKNINIHLVKANRIFPLQSSKVNKRCTYFYVYNY